MKARIQRNSSSKGQVLVETALCFVLLFGLLSGLMLLALTIYEYHSIPQTAREGSRWAAVRGSASCTATHVDHCNASATDIANYVAGLGFSHITASNVTVSWCTPPLGGTAGTCSAATANDPGNLVQVQVRYSTTLVAPMLSSNAITMGSTSQMLISQ
jgi:Flp pilus assembly protein TadG